MRLRTYIRNACIWVLLAFWASAMLWAQRQMYRQYGPSAGLKDLGVKCLLQDRTGYLWVGTENGLFRYDGAIFQRFSHAEGLPSAEIAGLAESPDGVLWVATQSGVARFSGKQFQVVNTGREAEFRSIAIDSSGRVYLGQPSGILLGVSDRHGSFQFHTVVRGAVHGIFVRSDGTILFGMDGGLLRASHNRIERIGSSSGLPADDWKAITEDSLHNVWVRSTQRLYEQAAGTLRFVERTDGIPQAAECSLYADRHGRVYVSSDAGLAVVDKGSMALLNASHGLPASAVVPVLVDREESLWIGSSRGLIRRLGHGEWLSWEKADGLPHSTVWAVLHDGLGQLWSGTTGGLGIFNPQGKLVHTWNSRNGLAGDRVFSVLEGPSGRFFVGTDPAGISEFDKHGVLLKTHRSETGYTADQVMAMAIDRQHRLWAMGSGGCFRSRSPISRASPLIFDRMEIPGMPLRASFRAITLDQSGTVWLASSYGLARFDGKGWKVFTERDGLVASDLEAVVARGGDLWVAYRDSFGISRLHIKGDSLVAAHFTEQDGLSSDAVYALAIDLQGRLWANTDSGVSILEQGRWRHFSVEDGLIWNDTSGLGLSVDSAGSVWIGTSDGLSRYKPLPYPLPQTPSPVLLTSIKGVSQEWQPDNQPVLPYSQQSLFFSYASLSLASENRTHFRYRLLGYEKNWNDTSERSVRFAALPSGHYVFEVIAQNSDGVWSSVPAQFTFSIQPPWWRTWWFLSTSVLLAGLLGYALWHLRMQVLITQKNFLEQQVADRTKELSESHRQLEQIAYHDTLTSLPNRRRFTEELRTRLSLARRQDRSLVLLLTDLDHFKQINDTVGHDAGDAALMEAAVRLRICIRQSDCVARLGGDEFAVLLTPDEGKGEVEAVCRRILDAFAAAIPYKGASLKLGCSIGIAVFPADGDTQETLYKSADLALYQAKRMGRNLSCWHHAENAAQRSLIQNQVASTPLQA